MSIFKLPKIGSRRAVGRAFIPQLSKLGYNPTRALAFLKLRGASYRKTTFLSDWRQILGIKLKRDPLRHVRKDRKPTDAVIQKTKDAQRHKFKHTYKATLYDTEQGKYTTHHISIGTNQDRKIGELDEMAYVITSSFKYSEAGRFIVSKVDRESITMSTVTMTPYFNEEEGEL